MIQLYMLVICFLCVLVWWSFLINKFWANNVYVNWKSHVKLQMDHACCLKLDYFKFPLYNFKLKTITPWICSHSFAMGHLELLLFKSIFFCFPWMFEIHLTTSFQLYFNFLWLFFKHIKFPWLRIKFPDFSLTVTWPVATLEIQTPYFITLVLMHMVKKVSSDISMCIPNLVSTYSLLTRWAEITLVCGFLCFVLVRVSKNFI